MKKSIVNLLFYSLNHEMNILFVCSKNIWRSRTAETIFKNNGQHVIKSAGTVASARIRINQKMIDWADLIFVMEKKHKVRIVEKFDLDESTTELVNLEIPDDYQYMDEELIDMLESMVRPYF